MSLCGAKLPQAKVETKFLFSSSHRLAPIFSVKEGKGKSIETDSIVSGKVRLDLPLPLNKSQGIYEREICCSPHYSHPTPSHPTPPAQPPHTLTTLCQLYHLISP